MSTIGPGFGRCGRPTGGVLRHPIVPRLLVVACLAMLVAALPGRATSAPGPSAASHASADVEWQWPLRPAPNEVVHGFNLPDDRWSGGHRGVDLRGMSGEGVRTAGAGVVTFAGVLAGRGVVTVTHGALRTTYEPVTAAVTVGDRVDAGDVIATLDLIGGHCLPNACLHWGLLRGNTYLDPLSLVGGGPVRLLPLDDKPAAAGAAAAGPTGGDPSGRSSIQRAPGEEGRPRASPAAASAARVTAVLGGLAAAGTAVAIRRRRRGTP